MSPGNTEDLFPWHSNPHLSASFLLLKIPAKGPELLSCLSTSQKCVLREKQVQPKRFHSKSVHYEVVDHSQKLGPKLNAWQQLLTWRNSGSPRMDTWTPFQMTPFERIIVTQYLPPTVTGQVDNESVVDTGASLCRKKLSKVYNETVSSGSRILLDSWSLAGKGTRLHCPHCPCAQPLCLAPQAHSAQAWCEHEANQTQEQRPSTS